MSKRDYFPQPSVNSAQQHFAQVPRAEIERSRFDRSHAHKTTMDEGWLVPVFVDEVIPGDTFNLKETTFCRLSTPLRPVMDNMYLETFYFFVPYRLCWDNWQRFMGERDNPSDNPDDYSVPEFPIAMSNVLAGTLANYMGIPIIPNPTGLSVNVSALPFRAYWLIWNEWFRDQNLCDSVVVDKGDGPDTALAFLTMPGKRGKRHDYFTSALPWPQKGDAVYIPVGGVVVPDGAAPTFMKNGNTWTGELNIGNTAATPPGVVTAVGVAGTTATLKWDNPHLKVDQDQGAVTINDLRTAFQIQKLRERDARGGTRYIELVLSHFGVRSPDARLQRPEYLGGGSTRININPVASTFRNTEVAQGELGGFGTALNNASFNKSFTEHGVIIGLANVRADLTYQNGLERFWKRFTRFDYYWPSFAHLGEQIIANSEILLMCNQYDGVAFGFQERFAEYRYKPSRISGKFSSNDPESLDVWHLASDYQALPALNKSFIEEFPPIDRIVAVPSEPHFMLDIWFKLECERPMPVYSVPGLVDHF